MTNFEYYKDTILEMCNIGADLTVKNGELTRCTNTFCHDCDFHKNDSCTASLIKWLYEEHIEQQKLTKKERQFCELIETGYICRDNHCGLWWFKYRPNKNGSKCWDNGCAMNCISNLPCKFSFIQWEDEEPWSVEELLKLEVEE